jgi:hypothetical protein
MKNEIEKNGTPAVKSADIKLSQKKVTMHYYRATRVGR